MSAAAASTSCSCSTRLARERPALPRTCACTRTTARSARCSCTLIRPLRARARLCTRVAAAACFFCVFFAVTAWRPALPRSADCTDVAAAAALLRMSDAIDFFASSPTSPPTAARRAHHPAEATAPAEAEETAEACRRLRRRTCAAWRAAENYLGRRSRFLRGEFVWLRRAQ